MPDTTRSDLPLARKMWRTMEVYHSLVYFTDRTRAYEELGLERRENYFTARSAPLGVVPAEVVQATFFNFHPDYVRSVVPGVWSRVTPEAVVAARLRVADEGLRALLGDDVVTSPEVAEAAVLARRAAEAAAGDLAGRALAAAHAALPWPDAPHLVLWHAVSVLREHRGDAHLAALVAAGLDACEALVTHAGAGDGLFDATVLRTSRGWSVQEWAAAVDRLADRGWVDATGALTDAGRAGRDRIEAVTDGVSGRPWTALTGDEANRLRELVRPLSRAIVASGVFMTNPHV